LEYQTVEWVIFALRRGKHCAKILLFDFVYFWRCCLLWFRPMLT